MSARPYRIEVARWYGRRRALSKGCMTITTTGDESRKLAIAFSESSAQVPFDFEMDVTNRD
jgi:hypothetical protein